MSIEQRLKLAKLGIAEFQSDEKIVFAWYPVRIGPCYGKGKWKWLCHVRKFVPLGLTSLTEYYEL